MSLTDGRYIIDSREIIERIDELEALGTPEHAEPGEDAYTGLDQDEADELESLRKFQDEMSDYCPDWEYGETLVSDYYFVTYAQELADDIGAVPSDLSWPMTCIDWEQAARELRMDYTSAELGGHTYWGR